MDEKPKSDGFTKKDDVSADFHQLMLKALRQRESEIIQFIAIFAAALAGFGWLAQVTLSTPKISEVCLTAISQASIECPDYGPDYVDSIKNVVHNIINANPDSFNTGIFVIGTIAVILLLTVGACYALSLGYNYRYITMQIAKIEAQLQISQLRLVKWPKSPDDFIKRYGCYCKPPEIIQVFWISFLFAIAGVTLAAVLLMPKALVLWTIIPSGEIFLFLGWYLPHYYGKKIKDLAYIEKEHGNW